MFLQRPHPGARPAPGREAARSPRAHLSALPTGLGILLAALVAAQPVLAEDCLPTAAAFPPGHWVASGINRTLDDTDDISTLVGTETGWFDVEISEAGVADGVFAVSGEGGLEMKGSDDGWSYAQWLKSGEISGTAMVLQVDGTFQLQIEGEVDTSPLHTADPITGGDDLWDFSNTIEQPFSLQFGATAASCNQVVGTLGGPLEYGTAQGSVFIAFRVGARAAGVDVQGQLAELLEAADTVLNMDPVDTEVLAGFVADMLAFESMLASLEACDPGNELDMGGTWLLLQSVMFNTMRHYLDAAALGNYATRDVITAVGIWAQGGSLGWRDGDCLNPVGADDGALDLFTKFEDVLLERYPNASDADQALIAAAAYQYGMPRLIAEVEGGN